MPELMTFLPDGSVFDIEREFYCHTCEDWRDVSENQCDIVCDACKSIVATFRDRNIISRITATDPRVGQLVEALERIERWFGEFPATGRTWDDKPGGEPMSYVAVHGTNGERDFMRGIAREALAAAKGEPASERPWTRSEERMPPASWLKSDVWEVRGGNLEGVKIMMSVYGQNEQPLWANLDGYVCVIAGTEWRPVEG